MKRLEDTELGKLASTSARTQFKDSIRTFDMVKMNLALNAHIAGYWAGARHAEKYDGNKDPRSWWQRLKFWNHWPTVGELAVKMSTGYLASFPSLSMEDGAMVMSASTTGFEYGWSARVAMGDT